MNIYLVQVNNTYGLNAFLPYSVGLLQSYALTIEAIRDNYDFKGFVFLRENVDDVVNRLDNPSVVGVSCYIWNFEYSIALGRAIKSKFPNCLIVFGGPHIPVKSEKFFERHNFVDILVHYEGEITFSEILLERLKDKPDYTKVEGISLNVAGKSLQTKFRERIDDLDIIPSPYISGIFDELMKQPYDFHASQETHRGCPYSSFAGDTIIALPDRLIKLGNEKYSNELALNCQDISHQHRICVDDDRIMQQGVKQCIKFTYNNNISLKVTNNHPMFVVRDEKIMDCKANELSIGDWVPIEVGQNKIIKMLELNEPSKILSETMPGQGARKPKQINMPKVLDEDVAWLMGFIIGDGCIPSDNRSSIHFCVTDDIREKLTTILAKLGLTLKEHVAQNTVKMKHGQVHSRKFQQLLVECLGMETTKNKLTVPHTIFKSPIIVIKSFLRGLLDADGYAPKHGEEYLTTKSSELANDVAALIHWIGDAAVIRKIKSSGLSKDTHFYRVEWHSQKCFDRLVGHQCIASRIPIKKEAYVDRHKKWRWHKTIQKRNIGVTRSKLYQIDPNHELLNRSYVYAQIINIEDAGLLPTYDVHNHPSHTVGANGIFCRQCTFCDWGSNVMAKIKQFSTERLVEELKWFSNNKIDLLYNCDANYGILPRDIELTHRMAEINRSTGFPKKFRAAYAKNSNDTIFNIAKILNDHGMNKGITLSFQSMDDKTLLVVKRKNIKIDNFKNLMKKYKETGIATYSELIIGLPGETYKSFVDGIDLLIKCGQHDSIQVYNCEVLPNSEMNDELYKQAHGIKSTRTKVLFFHGTPSDDKYQEYYEIVTETAVLSREHWMKSCVFSCVVQCFHCLSLTQCIAQIMFERYGIDYKLFYEELIVYSDKCDIIKKVVDVIKNAYTNLSIGNEWGVINEKFGNIIWPPEEGAFLQVVLAIDGFYNEVKEFLKYIKPDIEQNMLDDIVEYQKSIMKFPYQKKTSICLDHNIHECVNNNIELRRGMVLYEIVPDKTYEDLELYAKEVVWYGRKGGKFKHTNVKEIL